MSYFFTSESVSEGHPDKVCDAISDNLLDFYLSHDSKARTAIEVLATTNKVILSGEISSSWHPDTEEIFRVVKETISHIGYNQTDFSAETVDIENYLHAQSPDIALGVDRMGAGDQGIMFGYACKEDGFDTDYMPLPIYLAHKALYDISVSRHNRLISGIEPDSKSQFTIEYDNQGKPQRISKIVLSTQHNSKLSSEDVRQIVIKQLQKSIPETLLSEDTSILINPTGRFVIGGPAGDTGLTGRKIIVDTYGGAAPHGGGAFSGKDPTKVDRSAAYMMRYLAKNIVAAGLAKECLLQISYAIGVAEPLSLYINTKGTARFDEQQILNAVHKMVNLTPEGIIQHLELRRPIYGQTSAYGHFGRSPDNRGHFSWEKLDLVKELQNAFNIR
ncbi:MAG: methionine adenosyltransferase [Alphaproteobacteria bacterium]|nr:methionine adenosyltransferase [Alphaproteobacteria bacterium]